MTGHHPQQHRRPAAIIVSVAAVVLLSAPGAASLTPRELPAPLVSLAASLIPGHPMPAAVAVSTPVGLVDICARLPDATAAGTGIVLSSDGEVVTNDHVVTGSSTITATDPATGRTYTAAVLGVDARRDIAVLQLQDADGLAPAALADSNDVEIGDPVEAAGNAGGRGAPTIATGQVTGLRKSVIAQNEYRHQQHRFTGVIEIDATVQPGDSGGPLFTERGVIGMDTAAVSGGAGFAIPINTVLSTVHRFESSEPADPAPDEQALRTRSSGLAVRPILAVG
jgi:S1-C subfamily serine protease